MPIIWDAQLHICRGEVRGKRALHRSCTVQSAHAAHAHILPISPQCPVVGKSEETGLATLSSRSLTAYKRTQKSRPSCWTYRAISTECISPVSIIPHDDSQRSVATLPQVPSVAESHSQCSSSQWRRRCTLLAASTLSILQAFDPLFQCHSEFWSTSLSGIVPPTGLTDCTMTRF